MHTKYNEKYTRELLTDAITNSVGVAGVLRYLEIPWSGGTHAHISRRIKQLGIDTSHFKRVAPNKGSKHSAHPRVVTGSAGFHGGYGENARAGGRQGLPSMRSCRTSMAFLPCLRAVSM